MVDTTQAKEDILKSVAKKKPVKKPKDSRDVRPPQVPASSSSSGGPEQDFIMELANGTREPTKLGQLLLDTLDKVGQKMPAVQVAKGIVAAIKGERPAAPVEGLDPSAAKPAPEGDPEPDINAPEIETKGDTRVFKTSPSASASGTETAYMADQPQRFKQGSTDRAERIVGKPVPTSVITEPAPTANDTKPFSFTGKGVPTSPIIDERKAPTVPETRNFIPGPESEVWPGWVDSIMNPRTTSDGMGGPGPGMTAKDIMDWKNRGFTTEPYRAKAQENRYGGKEYRAEGQKALDSAESRLEQQLAQAPVTPVERPPATAAGAAKDMAAGTPPNLGPTSWMDDFVRFASVQPDVAPASPTAPAPAPAARSAPAPAPAPAVVPKEALSPVEQRMAVAQITPRLTTTDPRAPIHGGSMASEIMQGPFGTAPTVGAFDKTVGPADAPQTKRTELGYELGQRIGSTIFDPGKAEGAPTVNAAEPIRMDPSQGAPIGSLPPIRPGATPPPEAQNVRQGINPLNNSPFTTYSMGGWDVTSFGDGSAIRSTPGVEGYTQSWNPQTSSWSGSPQMGGAALPNTAPSKPSPQVFSGPNSNPTPNWSDPHP